MWYLYIIECSNGSLYTGITKDVERRISEHETGLKGAKFTRGKGPFKLKYLAEFGDKASASSEEYRIKKLTKSDKMKLIESYKKD
jgi:putative endonuclease